MDDNTIVVTAAVAAVAALVAEHVPGRAWLLLGAVAVGLLAVGASVRRYRRSHGRAGARHQIGVQVVVGAGLFCLVVAATGLRSHQDLAGLARPLPTEVAGPAELAGDPTAAPWGTRVELTVDGRRYLAEFDRSTESAVAHLRAGDRIRVAGEVRPFRQAPVGWVRSRHLAGRVEVRTAIDTGHSLPWFRAANRLHELLDAGAASMSVAHRSLYLGLVVGDDRGQDEVTRFRFRASGLTHLLAVSGQNLVFVLAVLSPLSSRVTFRWRWVLGAAAIVGFVLVTRAEPSVLRAAVMAVLGITAAATGRWMPGMRLLATAVVLLLLGDPLLVHSVGFRLSVAATLGLVLLTRPLERAVPGPAWLVRPLAVTLAAQTGAVPVMAATFGTTSVLAVPANLLAGPAAGAVMTLGMTSGLAAGAVREELAWVLQVPVRVAVWWVDGVATTTAGLSAPPVGVGWWSVLLIAAAAAVWSWRMWGLGCVGRSCVVAVLPWLVVARPPAPERSEAVEVSDGTVAMPACGAWNVVVADRRLDDRGVAGVLEGLWRMGLGRVDRVMLGPDAPAGNAAGVERLAAALRAESAAAPAGVLPCDGVSVDRPP